MIQNKAELERKVNYSKTHQVHGKTFDDLIENLELYSGARILDFMGGYGEVTNRILDYCATKGIVVYPTLSDISLAQVKKGRPDIQKVVADARESCFAPKSFDRIVIKMGLHEVCENDQEKIIKNAYNILGNKSSLLIWDFMPETEEERGVYADIFKKKDALSGFKRMVLERCWTRESRIQRYLADAGFAQINSIHKSPFRAKTSHWLANDLASGVDENEAKNRLQIWNDYIRMNIPSHLKEKWSYKDNGDFIELEFPNMVNIIKAVKN